MPDLPIFSQFRSIKGNFKASTSTPLTQNSNFNAMPFFFTIPPQMFPFAQNLTTNNSSNSILSSPKQLTILTLDEFFTKLNESSGGTGEFARFKNIFEDEWITVNQIYDLTDTEFDHLGVNKIGWRKAFKAASQRYK